MLDYYQGLLEMKQVVEGVKVAPMIQAVLEGWKMQEVVVGLKTQGVAENLMNLEAVTKEEEEEEAVRSKTVGAAN